MRVLVAGAGYVGLALAKQLAAAGHAVWALKRSATAMPQGVELVLGNMLDPASLQNLPPNLDAMVYTAAADASSPEAYREAYVDGLGYLLAHLAKTALPKRVLFTSSTSVYAQDDGSWVDETSVTAPKDFRGQVLLQAEHLITELPTQAAVLRLGGIYGPGRTRLMQSVRNQTAELHGNGGGFTNRIHRDDCAGALAHLLEVPQLAPLYVGVDREPAQKNDVVCWLAKTLQVPVPSLGNVTASLGKRCNSLRLQQSGFVFRYPTYREGYGALIAAG